LVEVSMIVFMPIVVRESTVVLAPACACGMTASR
jgi:hypothetical protein